jgi:hypothetical protein
MKKLAFFTVLAAGFGLPMISGCGGGGENTVIEAPAETGPEEAIPGMSDEDYNAAMEADMQG